MSREAMKQALEALEADEQDMVADKDGHMVFRVDAAITALRQALASVDTDDTSTKRVDETGENVHEPVAWADDCRIELVTAIHMLSSDFENALYAFRGDTEARKSAEGSIAHALGVAVKWNRNGRTSPPPRQPLTDEEIWEFWYLRPEVPEGEDDSMEAEFVAAVRRVLAAHGIKGEA